MIRPATLDDLDVLVELGRRMHAESERFSRLTFDSAKVRNLLARLIPSEDALVLVVESPGGEVTGGFVGYMTAHWYSEEKAAQDLSLFVRPDRRGGIAAAAMVNRFVEWARGRGCKQIVLGISTGVRVEQTSELYHRLGLKQFGLSFEV